MLAWNVACEGARNFNSKIATQRLLPLCASGVVYSRSSAIGMQGKLGHVGADDSLVGCRFDRANTFRKMVDCQFVAAMGLPGGGRTFITPRFARHFHHVGICEFDSDTMTRIFSTILGHFFNKVRCLACRIACAAAAADAAASASDLPAHDVRHLCKSSRHYFPATSLMRP